jgi:hypothetical protein
VACPLWVKSGKARVEHLTSAFHSKADVALSLRHVSLVPEADITYEAVSRREIE